VASLIHWLPTAFRPRATPPIISIDGQGNIYAGFDAATDEEIEVSGELVSQFQNTGDITLRIRWRADTATTGNVVWSAQIEALSADDAVDTDSASSFAAAQTVTDAAPAAAGRQTVAEITFTQAEADSPAAGDRIRIRLSRDANNASDTMAGDAEILAIELRDAA
jgi:hypothetical protein